MRWSIRSLPTQPFLWLCEIKQLNGVKDVHAVLSFSYQLIYSYFHCWRTHWITWPVSLIKNIPISNRSSTLWQCRVLELLDKHKIWVSVGASSIVYIPPFPMQDSPGSPTRVPLDQAGSEPSPRSSQTASLVLCPPQMEQGLRAALPPAPGHQLGGRLGRFWGCPHAHQRANTLFCTSESIL